MEYLNVYLQKHIIEYLSPSENFLIKFVNKHFYKVFIYFSIINKYPSKKEIRNIEVLKWFIYNIPNVPIKLQKDITKVLISKGQNNDFIFCLSKYFECCEKTIFTALKFKNYEVLEILMSRKHNFDYQTILYACEIGNYKVLKWIFKNKNLCQEKLEQTDYLSELLPLAINSKNLDCVKFLINKKCHINYSVLLLTITISELDIFAHILDAISYDLSVFFWPHNLIESAFAVSKLDMIQYIYDKFRPVLNENLYDILLDNYNRNYKKEKTIECILWLIKKNCKYNISQKESLFKYNFFI